MANLFNNLQQNPMQNMMQRFQQFKQTFSGNPQQIVQQMLSSGKVSQEQYNQAVQMANQFKQFLK